MPKPKVLIVEDDKKLQRLFCIWLEDYFEVLSAFTIQEAEELVTKHPDIAAVAMDGCVPGDELNTAPLTKKIRAGFSGPIIAISSVADYRLRLITAGCDYWCEKLELETILKKIFEV